MEGRREDIIPPVALFPCFLGRRIQITKKMHAAVKIVKGTVIRYTFLGIDFALQSMCLEARGSVLAVAGYPGHKVDWGLDREVDREAGHEVGHEAGHEVAREVDGRLEVK